MQTLLLKVSCVFLTVILLTPVESLTPQDSVSTPWALKLHTVNEQGHSPLSCLLETSSLFCGIFDL